MKRLVGLSFILVLVLAVFLNAQKMDFKAKMLVELDPNIIDDQGIRKNKDGAMQLTTTSAAAKELYLKAEKLIDDFKSEEAIPLLEKAISLDENFAMAHLRLAQELDNHEKAFEHFQKVLKLVGKVSEGEALWIKYVNALAFGPMDDSRTLRDKLDSLFPDDKRIQFEIGASYFQDNLKKAIEHFEKSVKLDPDFAPAYNMLGYSYAKQNEFQEAEKAFKKYAELQPNSSNPYDSYAEMLLKQGRYDESIAQYRKALSIDPSFYYSLLGMGHNYIFKGDFNKARQYYSQLFNEAKSKGYKYDALYNEAISYLHEGRTEDALKTMDRYRELATSDENYSEASTAARRKSYILAETGNTKEAMEQNKQAFDLLEKFKATETEKKLNKEWLNLDKSFILIKKGDLKEARLQLEKSGTVLSDQKGGDIDKYFNTVMGELCLKEGDYDEALKYLSGGFTTTPENLYYTAQAYQKKGDNEKVRECLEKILNSNENSVGLAIMRPRVREILSAK